MGDRTATGRGADLDHRLDAYETQARAGADRGHLARWPTYAAAVGSSLALATAADAEIIYSGVQNVTVTRPSNTAQGSFTNTKPFNVGGAAFQLSAFRHNRIRGEVSTVGVFLKALAPGAAFRASSSSVSNFAPGSAIAAGGPFSRGPGTVRDATNLSSNAHYFGRFPSSGSGFAGIKIHESDGDHFGWIRLVVTSSLVGFEGFKAPETLTAVDWAFENVPGAPIDPGQETGGVPPAAGPVPEPSSLALMLLAAGSAGVLAWRDRRKAAQGAA